MKINMDSASFEFLAFGLTVALVSNFSRSRIWRSVVLFLASLVFLGILAHNPVPLLPLAGFLLLGYSCYILVDRKVFRSTAWTIVAVIFVYIWLKKYTVLPEGSFLHFPYFTLGLSYIFFRVLHLLIETGDSRDARHVGPGAFLLYTLNFTTFASGPLQRYDEFARDQFASEPIPLGPRVIGLQLERIIRGFFKVNVLAMLFNAVQEDALAQLTPQFPLGLRLFAAFRVAVVYPFFLYSNFSGYIDIVLGLARLMRVRLPENFDRPFSASSFIDFWNRWHITLSTWLKNYVYNPMFIALMRRVSSQTIQPLLGILCSFVTFFLVGIWHGRTSEFVVFGLLQGGGLAMNKLWQLWLTRILGRRGYKELAKKPLYIAFGRGLTFSWFAFTILWFWAGWSEINAFFSAFSVLNWLGIWLAIWLSATVVLAAWEALRALLLSIRTSEGPVLTSRYARVIYASALGFLGALITVLLNQSAPEIVYKVF